MPGEIKDIGSILESGKPLEGGIATHSNTLAWRIPMDRGAGRLQFMES
jgi:hypothetical protein